MKKFFVGYLMLSLFSLFNLKSSQRYSSPKEIGYSLEEWKRASVELRRSCSEKMLEPKSDDEWQDVDGLTLEVKNPKKPLVSNKQEKKQVKPEIRRPIPQVPSCTHSQASSNASTVVTRNLQEEQSLIVRPIINSFRRHNSFDGNTTSSTEIESFSKINNDSPSNDLDVDGCLLGAIAFGSYLLRKAQEAFNGPFFDSISKEAKDAQRKTNHKD